MYLYLNNKTDRQKNKRTDKQTNGLTNGQTNGPTTGQTNKGTDEQTKRWTDARIKTERNLRELTITKEVNKQEIKEERRLFTISKLQAFKARFMYKYVLYC